jgi:hypothetical protein
MTISATTRGLRPGVCTSTNRPSSPFDGMLIYETDTNRVAVYDSSAWVYKTPASTTGSVLQVVSTVKSDTFSTTSTSYTDVTGMSVTITPSSTNSKILVLGDYAIACFQPGGTTYFYVQLVRASTAIYLGDTAGSRSRVHFGGNNKNGVDRTSLVFLDSPATTSATTYKLQVKKKDWTGTIFLNRSETADADADTSMRVASSITVMEIAG